MDFLKYIAPDDLPEEQKNIADLIGMEAYSKLVNAYGGMAIYITKPDNLIRNARNEEIRSKFDGSNYRQLAVKYNLSEVSIRLIVADIDREMRKKPIDGQMTLL